VYVLLVRGLHEPKLTAEIAAIALVFLVRVLSIWRGWTLPERAISLQIGSGSAAARARPTNEAPIAASRKREPR
jgi:hypothetical protein